MRHPGQDDLIGFALGALEPDDEGRVADHVERCKACTVALRGFAPAVAVLAESVEQLEPPPQLRQRLLETVNREAASSASTQDERSVRPRRSWLSGILLRPATGLAAVALVAAAIGGFLLADGGDSEQQATTVAAKSTLPRAGGSLVVRGDETTLHVHGMPLLNSKNAVYQVWVADGATVHPSANFIPKEDGTATAAVPEAAEGATEVTVTREPDPNRQVPSGPQVLRAQLN